jgi:ankyrin repeat protein
MCGGKVRKAISILIAVVLVSCSETDKQETFFNAVGRNDIEVVKGYLKTGTDVNQLYYSPKHKMQMAPLHLAAILSNEEMIDFLLNNGAEINIKNADGTTPLQYAISKERYQVAKLLIEKGADVNNKGYRGATPLHDGVLTNQKEIAELLIKSGADLNAEMTTALKPIDMARKLKHNELVDLLLKHSVKMGTFLTK